MDKKKIFAIALFLLLGLFMFSYANPLNGDDSNLSPELDNNQAENTNTDNLNNESNTTNKLNKKQTNVGNITSVNNLINDTNSIDNNVINYIITFVDGYNSEIITTVVVESGNSVVPPIAPVHSNQVFSSWE